MIHNCEKYQDWGFLFVRVVVGAIFILAGYGKLFGGIEGFAGMLAGLGVPAPVVFAWIVGLIEFIGGALILLGLFARKTPIALILVMLVAAYVQWSGGGFGRARLDVLLLSVLVLFTMTGAGKLSLDHIWCKPKAKSSKKSKK